MKLVWEDSIEFHNQVVPKLIILVQLEVEHHLQLQATGDNPGCVLQAVLESSHPRAVQVILVCDAFAMEGGDGRNGGGGGQCANTKRNTLWQ